MLVRRKIDVRQEQQQVSHGRKRNYKAGAVVFLCGAPQQPEKNKKKLNNILERRNNEEQVFDPQELKTTCCS
jgi:predicted Zn-dependent peptidase